MGIFCKRSIILPHISAERLYPLLQIRNLCLVREIAQDLNCHPSAPEAACVADFLHFIRREISGRQKSPQGLHPVLFLAVLGNRYDAATMDHACHSILKPCILGQGHLPVIPVQLLELIISSAIALCQLPVDFLRRKRLAVDIEMAGRTDAREHQRQK